MRLLVCIIYSSIILMGIGGVQGTLAQENISVTLEPEFLIPEQNTTQILTFNLTSLIHEKNLDPDFPYSIIIWKDDELVAGHWYVGDNGKFSISLIPKETICYDFELIRCTEYLPEYKTDGIPLFFENYEIISSAFGKPGKYEVRLRIYNNFDMGSIIADAVIFPIYSKSFVFNILDGTNEFSLPKSFQVMDRRETGLMEYIIPYDLSSGTIKDVNVICNGAEVYLLLDNSEKTKLTITIPIKMLSSFRHDFIDIFVVVNHDETDFEIISVNSDNLTIQFDIPFVNAETYMYFDGSARTSNWKKENCQFDRILVMDQPPKIQVREGIPIDRISCFGDHHLIFEATDNSPACVKPESIPKLIERGWAKSE